MESVEPFRMRSGTNRQTDLCLYYIFRHVYTYVLLSKYYEWIFHELEMSYLELMDDCDKSCAFHFLKSHFPSSHRVIQKCAEWDFVVAHTLRLLHYTTYNICFELVHTSHTYVFSTPWTLSRDGRLFHVLHSIARRSKTNCYHKVW